MLIALLLPLTQEAPAAEDVKAGWIAFVVFIGLIAAVAVLGLSLVKHLRRAEAAKNAGVFGDEPVTPADTEQAAPDDERPAGS